MATLTVPGANGSIVSNNFSSAGNQALAQSIAATLSNLFAAGQLSTTSVAGGGVAPPPPGPPPPFGARSLEITSGGAVSVPAGYGYVVDGSNGANLSITGGPSFFGGDGNISYTNTSVGGPVSVVAGNGNDSFNLSGTYTVAAGSGFDHYNLSGTGQVSLGGGTNLVSITGGADTIFAATNPGPTGIVGGKGAVFFYAGSSNTQVLDVIVGGTAGDTLVGANNNVLVYASSASANASTPGAVLIAGGGNETLFGAASKTNDQLWGSFTGGNDYIAAGSGDDALVAGTGNTSLVGGSGTDTFYVINSQLLSTITKTAVTPGVDFLYNTHAGETLALTGFDTLYGGAAGSGAAAKAVQSQLAGGGNSVMLKDGTQITFATGVNGIKVISS